MSAEPLSHRYSLLLDRSRLEYLVIKVMGTHWRVDTETMTSPRQKITWATCGSLPEAVAEAKEYLVRYYYYDDTAKKRLNGFVPALPDWAMAEALLGELEHA